jgi:hypothetical protein
MLGRMTALDVISQHFGSFADSSSTTGVAPTNDLESAILRTVAPGNYTAILSGRNNATGIGLVEVYKLP